MVVSLCLALPSFMPWRLPYPSSWTLAWSDRGQLHEGAQSINGVSLCRLQLRTLSRGCSQCWLPWASCPSSDAQRCGTSASLH